jgi:hypothetical protein
MAAIRSGVSKKMRSGLWYAPTPCYRDGCRLGRRGRYTVA